MAAPWARDGIRKLICFYLNISLITTLILNCKEISCDPSVSEDFDVKPGGQVWTTVKELGPFKCSFQYAAQGGTNEQWQFDLTGSEDGSSFICDIKRPSGMSYLFFQSFKVSVDLQGATLKHVTLFKDTENPLKQQEYIVNKYRNEVTHNEAGFDSKLSRLILLVERPRTEL